MFEAKENLLLAVILPETAVSRAVLALLPVHQGHEAVQQSVLLQPGDLKCWTVRSEQDCGVWTTAMLVTRPAGPGFLHLFKTFFYLVMLVLPLVVGGCWCGRTEDRRW